MSSEEIVIETKGASVLGDSRITSRSLKANTATSVGKISSTGELKWIRQQRKAFVAWCNAFLAQRSMKIEGLEEDLQTGVYLINLVELLAGKKLPTYNKTPRIKVQKVLNNQIALDHITKVEKLKLVGIGPEDIHDGNTKLILGLIWTLILRFQIQAGRWSESVGKKSSPKQDLLDWLNGVLASRGVSVTNFAGDFSDGMVLWHLANYLLAQQGKAPLGDGQVPSDVIELFNMVFGRAEKDLGIPQLLDAIDMDAPDELAVMTYVSYFRQYDNMGPGERPRGLSNAGDQSYTTYTSSSYSSSAAAAAPAPVAEPPVKSSKGFERVATVDAEGDGLSHAICGETTTYTLYTKSDSGDTFYSADTVLYATLALAGSGGNDHIVRCTFTDHKNGKYTAAYEVEQAGIYDLIILMNAQQIRPKPFVVTAVPGEISAPDCSADGKGLILAKVGENATFKVYLRDRKGNFIDRSSSSDVKVRVEPATGKNAVSSSVRSESNGVYISDYTPERSGAHRVHVDVNGRPIKASPYTVFVEAAAAAIDKTTADGPGTSKAIAGENTQFFIYVRDRFGNLIPSHSGHALTAVLTGAAEDITATIQPKEDGSYIAQYEATASGPHKLHVRYNQTDIPNSPFTVIVESGAISSARCIAEGPGLTAARSGEEAQFVIIAMDRHRNRVGKGGARVDVTLEGPERANGVARDNKDGTYSVTYKVNPSGTYRLNALVDGKAIKGSPFEPVVSAGSAAAGSSTVEGIERYKKGVAAGEPIVFTVHPRDAAGNSISDSTAELKVASEPDATITEIKQNSNGTYSVTANPTRPGDYKFDVTLNKASVKNSPFVLQVNPGAVVGENSIAEGKGVTYAVAGERTEFTIITLDQYGNRQTKGGATVAASIEGPERIIPTITDNKNGTYTAVYTAKVAGDFNLTATANGSAITGCPHAGKVVAGKPSARFTTVSGPGISTAEAGTQAEFSVRVRDQYENPVVSFVDVASSMTGPADIPVAVAQDGNDGIYNATYTPKVAGKYKLAVTMGNLAVKGSPFEVDVVPGPLSPSDSVAKGPGTTEARCGEPARFTVLPQDAYGNMIPHKSTSSPKVHVNGSPSDVVVSENKRGGYNVEYTTTKAGPTTLDVFLDGQHVSQSPFQLYAAAGKSTNLSAEGPGLSYVTSGEPATFVVTSYDKHGNEVSTGGQKVSARITGPEKITVKIVDTNNGKYLGSYTASVSGTYRLNIVCDGSDIQGSPYDVKISAGSASPKKSELVVAKDSVACGNIYTVKLLIKDAAGNLTPYTQDMIINGSLDGPEHIDLVVKPQADGTVILEGRPTKPGAYKGVVQLSGEGVSNSPFNATVVPGRASARDSYATGTGLTEAVAGEAANATVHVKDEFGNELKSGGDSVTASIEGPAQVTPSIKDNKNGTYAVTYTATVSGVYQLALNVNDTPVQNSPFTVNVATAALDATKSIAFGDGLIETEAGKPARFTVQPKDKYNNNLRPGLVPVTAYLQVGDQKIPVTVTDKNNDGLYEMEYVPLVAGKHKVHVFVDGKPVKDSPFTVVVQPGQPDASNTIAKGEGLNSSTANEPAFFTIVSHDAHGNPVKAGGRRVYSVVKGPQEIPVKITDKNDGTYGAEYTPTVAGQYEVHVTFNDAPIKSSPFPLQVQAGSTSISNTTASGEGLSTAVAGKEATFLVTAKDANGNLVGHGGDKIHAGIKGPEQIDVKVSDKGDGTYVCTYVPQKSGTYAIRVAVGPEAIKDSPFNLTVSHGAIDPSQGTIISDGYNLAVAGITESFIVQSKDAYGNNLKSGGAKFDVTYSEPITVQTRDNGDGTYTGTYTPTKAGAGSLDIKLNGTPIRDSPVPVSVVPGAAAGGQSYAEGNGLTKANAGEPAHFTITLVDQFGNKLKSGGADVQAQYQPNASLESEVIDNNDGTYSAKYKAIKSGPMAIGITVGSVTIKDSPFMAIVETGPPSAGHSTASGPGLKGGKSGVESNFKVQPYDSYGNLITTGNAGFTSMLVEPGNKRTPITLVDGGNGSYNAIYTPTQNGPHAVHVYAASGSDIIDSPFKFAVTSGDVSASHSELTKVDPKDGVAGQNFITVAHTRDANRNAVTENVEVKLNVKDKDGAVVTVPFVSNKDGSHTATHKITIKGEYSLSAVVNGDNIKNSPQPYFIKPGPLSRKHCSIEVPESSAAGEPVAITVICRDEFGNIIDDADFEVEILGPDGKPVRTQKQRGKDGAYEIIIIPQASGPHGVYVGLGKDKPALIKTINVRPGKASAATTSASGDGVKYAIAGDKATFNITSTDDYGNSAPVPSPPSNLAARVVPQIKTDAQPITATIKDGQAGAKQAEYVATVAGKYNVEITLDDVPIKSSPYEIEVFNGAPSAPHTTAAGEALSQLNPAGEAGRVIITVRDAHNNIVVKSDKKTPVPLTAELVGAQGSANLDVKPQEHGEHAVDVKASAAGDYKLNIKLGDKHIAHSPFNIKIVPSDLEPGTCSAEGEGLSKSTAAVPAHFNVYSKDKYGNAVVKPGANVQGRLEGPKDVPVTFEDKHNGSYAATYVVMSDGRYKLHITIDGKPIAGSPFTVEAAQGAASPVHSELQGELQTKCGKEHELVLISKDAGDNKLKTGGAKVEARLEGVNANIKAKDKNNGKYELEISSIEKAGSYPLYVVMNGQPINGCPFTFVATPAAAERAIILSGAANKNIIAGTDGEYQIRTLDRFGNVVTIGGADVEFVLKGKNKYDGKIHDNEDGTYNASYNITQAGQYKAYVYINQKEAMEPFDVIVLPGSLSAGHSIAVGNGTKKSKGGEDAKFMIQSMDKFGNEIQVGGAKAEAVIVNDETGESFHVNIVDMQSGIYDATYQVETSGRYTLSVYLEGAHVQSSPFAVRVVSGPAFARTTVVKPLGNDIGKSKPGTSVYKFNLRDKHGNPRSKGGDQLKVFLRRPIRRPVKVTDNKDGSYDIAFPTGLDRGEYEMTAELGGEVVDLQNLKINIEEADPLPTDEAKLVENLFPTSADTIFDALRNMDETKKQAFLKDLQSMKR